MGSNFNLVTRPPKKTDDEDEDDLKDEDELEVEEVKKKSSDNAAKKRMIMFMGIIVGFTILLLIILFIASVAKGHNYSYEDIETILKNAAVSYFKDHPEYLPTTEGGVVEVDSSNLVVEGKMKDLSEYTKEGVSCTGSVQVEKSGSEYLYSPILNCGEYYLTVSLTSKVVSDNVVSSGYGLYEMNDGSYVFRGEDVNNYVELDNSLWRIVKVTTDGNLVLVNQNGAGYSQPWDDRYNEDRRYESGINEYRASRIKEYLEKVYKNPSKDDQEDVLSKDDKSKLVSYSLCIGKRTPSSESSDNSLECRTLYENQKLGLLTLSDYMMASIDPNCKNSETRSCKNYNYLVIDSDWWLVTANSDNDSTAYMVDRNGVVKADNASNYGLVRPVIRLNSKVMYKSGNGTLEKPFKVR